MLDRAGRRLALLAALRRPDLLVDVLASRVFDDSRTSSSSSRSRTAWPQLGRQTGRLAGGDLWGWRGDDIAPIRPGNGGTTSSLEHVVAELDD
jgi:hypothetical protein